MLSSLNHRLLEKDPMSTIVNHDPHLASLLLQESPVLSDSDIAQLMPFGAVQPTQAGDVLFASGDARYPLVVVLSGKVGVYGREGKHAGRGQGSREVRDSVAPAGV